MNIRVYIANLGAYNAGRLIGEWITLPCDDLESVTERVLMAHDEYGDYYGEEIAVHDYEAPFKIDEYDDLERLNEIAERLDALTEDDAVIEAVIDALSIEEALDVLENGDYRVWNDCSDMSDVAYAVTEECGALENVPDAIARYFDYEAYGRDLGIEGTFVRAGNDYVEIIR